jgi:rfaE bifunctional protein nucleotidyltransferase chain/domain
VSRTASKVLGLDLLAATLEPRRREGRTLALANGLFDILHVGHLRYLEGAARKADLLVVAINADASARALRGVLRPYVPQDHRAALLAGFQCVDYVTIFEDLTVKPLLRALRPDVHCKGTDYTNDTVPEAEAARELGIRIAITGDPKHHATTTLIDRIRSTRNSRLLE